MAILVMENPVIPNTVALLRTVESSWRIVRSVQTVSVANGPYSENIRSVHLIMTSEHIKPQQARSKCNIPRSISYKPQEARSKCNIKF